MRFWLSLLLTMLATVLITTLLSGCDGGTAAFSIQSYDGRCMYMHHAIDLLVSPDQRDDPETLEWGDRDLRIVVVGHFYDFEHADDHVLEQFASFINVRSPDIVVFGGDSIRGPAFDCDYAGLHSQWAALEAFKSRLYARVLMVAGNHDGAGTVPAMWAATRLAFMARNKINYDIDVGVRGRRVGLFFTFTGDDAPTAARLAPLSARFPRYSESLVFGGHGTEISGWPEILNEASTGHRVTYFSGDFQRDSRTTSLSHVDMHNVFSFCDGGFDADLIVVGRSETVVTPLGNCNR